MLLLHEALRPTSDMPTMLLDACTACRCMAAETLSTLLSTLVVLCFSIVPWTASVPQLRNRGPSKLD
jgi:hypothetical protein